MKAHNALPSSDYIKIAGLVTLTHAPKPMTFLSKLCERPGDERPHMLLIAVYPTLDARVPEHAKNKKTLE